MDNLQPTIDQIEEALGGLPIPHTPPRLYDPIRYFLKIGGKRARPLLTLLSAQVFNLPIGKVMPVAVAVELFHNFTLIHDDVMDQAPLRRGKQTVHNRWGLNTALLSGDVLFVLAYRELAKAQPEVLPKLLSLFNQTAAEVCEGQQLDMDFEMELRVPTEQYLEMIKLKTAVLIGFAMAAGAIVAQAPQHDVELLYQAGVQAGVGFQIMDDWLDAFAEPQAGFGKKIGGDILANKKTFLTVRAYEKADKYTTKKLDELLNNQQIDEHEKINGVLNIYRSLELKTTARQAMDNKFETAFSLLKKVEAPAANKVLLTEFLVGLMKRVN